MNSFLKKKLGKKNRKITSLPINTSLSWKLEARKRRKFWQCQTNDPRAYISSDKKLLSERLRSSEEDLYDFPILGVKYLILSGLLGGHESNSRPPMTSWDTSHAPAWVERTCRLSYFCYSYGYSNIFFQCISMGALTPMIVVRLTLARVRLFTASNL